MASLRSAARGTFVAALIGIGIATSPVRAWAVGEEITDIRVLDNQRTEESTVRSIAGISIGDTLESDTLDVVRERLNTTGLFADVNVWWEPHGSGVRVNISVKDKFPWAPVPTASWSANNKSLGLIFVHGNLFGRGKQLLIGARLAQIDSGAVLAYRDPSLFGTWMYWQLQGVVQRQVIPEYDSFGNGISLGSPVEFRETKLFSYGFEPAFGVAWMRRVKTQVAWHLEKFSFFGGGTGSDDPVTGVSLVPATNVGTAGYGRAMLSFDFRAREFSVMTGEALTGAFDYGGSAFGGDFNFWKAGASWEQGIKFFRAHNLVYAGGAVIGHDLPFWSENTAGGTNLRGYLGQQFRGDTQLWGKLEYHFPLFSISSLDFRALGFYDVQAIWFRETPEGTTVTDPNAVSPTYGSYVQRNTSDGRSFLAPPQVGFNRDAIHNDVGFGLRFFLRSVAVPLVGVDFGYGIEAANWQFIIVVGA
ncbi:MAG TPA: BamA/TamA family outer membrane protein [Polyangia bacterium]|nr:BamA/TamA family outer membrane protein [Polyangia bacterium]